MNSAKGLTVSPSSPSDETFLIRRMQQADIPWMAGIAVTEYFDSDLNAFLCPRRREYPDHLVRRFKQMMLGRYYNARSIGFVAAKPSSPHMPIAYAQFIRLGNDEAALRLIAQQSSFWRTVQKWWFQIKTSIVNFFWPDRSIDLDALRRFDKAAEHDDQQYWNSPDMKARYGSRWHAQSVVVSSPYQRKGIGWMLMGEVLQRAQDEGVVVGLEASGDGEKLYRQLGFRMRGPFSLIIGPPVGGIMMWTPKKIEYKEDC